MNSSNPVRGTRDISPEEMKLRKELEDKILSAFKSAGYNHIETPAIENLDLLMDSEGGENLRMLFTIAKRGKKFKPTENSTVSDLCDTGLRYDLTLPLSRYYSNNKESLENPFKSIQIGNVYRAERPQKGRFRSFKQCDIDIIGDHTIGAEIDLIHTISKALLEVGLDNFVIHLSDRKLLNAYIESFGFDKDQVGTIAISLDKLDKIGKDKVIDELVSKGLNKEKITELVNKAQDISLEEVKKLTGLDETCSNLERIIKAVNETSDGKYKIEFDFSLVRGMGYYTGPIFEIKWGEDAKSIAGGGRYDDMIGKTSKTSEPAVGFSIGFERLVDILMNVVELESEPVKKVLLLCDANKDNMADVISVADKFRAEGYVVSMANKKKNLGKQINKAKDKGYSYLYVYGRDSELKEL